MPSNKEPEELFIIIRSQYRKKNKDQELSTNADLSNEA